jgi:hypothetical protein
MELKPPTPSFWDRVHDSPFLAGESKDAPRKPADTRMLLHVSWWVLFVSPMLALLLSLDTGEARAPDDIVGVGAVLLPPILVSWLLAPVVLWKARLPHLTATRRRLHLGLGVALVAMCFLVLNLYGSLGARHRQEFGWQASVWLVAFLLWTVALLKVRRTIGASGNVIG